MFFTFKKGFVSRKVQNYILDFEKKEEYGK